MRLVTYTLLPDIAGKFLSKEAPLSEFARDVRWVFYRKTIPPLHLLNEALAHGASPREAEWQPFEIPESEYLELLEAIVGEPPAGYRYIQPPTDVRTHRDWLHWVDSASL
jgi:hypothetical protein